MLVKYGVRKGSDVMSQNRKWLNSFFLAVLFVGIGTEAIAEGVSKKKKKVDSDAVSSSLEEQTKQSPKVQPAQLPPGQRQLLSSSLASDQGVDVELSDFTRDTLLKDLSTKEMRSTSGKSQVVQTVNPEAAKRKTGNSTNLGVSRTRDIAQGYVAAPGISDFAWYFRASAAASRGSLENSVFAARPGSMDAEEFNKQSLADDLRRQTADSIRQILATRPSKEQRLELLLRLAEIQMERQAFATELEIRKFNDAHDKWQKAGMKGAEPVFKRDFAEQQRLVAVDALRAVVREYPTHTRTAEALFTLGFLLSQSLGDSSAALYFEKLIANFPNSDLVSDSYLALGEYHFSKAKFIDAQKSYQKVMDYKEKNPNAYNYAVYKLGWTYFNMRSGGEAKVKENIGKSLAAFKLVVKRAEGKSDDKVLKDLRRDALRDMVLVFADLGDVQGAEAYFEGLNEHELYVTMLERLAWQYSENGEYSQAVAIYQKLISQASDHVRLPQFYAHVPELFEKQGQTEALLQNLSVMARSLGPDSAWTKKFANDAQALASRDGILGKEFKGWAERFHAEAQKYNREKRYADALVAYGIYLEMFGTLPESYNAHFFRAEILARRGQYLEAADGYLRAVDLDEGQGLKGKYTNDAVVNSIACLDKVLAKSQPPNLPEAGKAAEKIPLTATHEKLVRSIDIFLRLFPYDKQNLEFSHRAARIVYAFGDYIGARKRWMTMASHYPKSVEVRDGLRLVLKVYLERKDWDNAISDSRAFLAIAGVNEALVGKEIVQVLKGAIFSKALALEEKDQRAKAADLFLAYQREFQDDPDSPKALFNAAGNRFKIGKIDEAISVLRILMTQYPTSPLVPNALYMVASANDSLGRFLESSAGYEKFSRENPKNAVSADIMLRAAEQRYGIGDSSMALRDIQDYLVFFPGHSSETKALFVAATVNLDSKKFSEAVKLFLQAAEKSLPRDPKMAVHMYGLAADTALKSGDKRRAVSSAALGVSIWQRLPEKGRTGVALEGVRLLALVQFSALDEKIGSWYTAHIENGAEIVDEFAAIRAKAQVVEQKYAEIVKLGNAEAGVAALYRIAEIREFLSNVLLKAAVPADASPSDVEQFRSNVEKIALPMADEAAKLYAAAWQKSNESEAITPFQQKLHDKLAVLRPAEFRTVITEMPSPTYYDSEIVLVPETTQVLKD